jgi:hypothetical protein
MASLTGSVPVAAKRSLNVSLIGSRTPQIPPTIRGQGLVMSLKYMPLTTQPTFEDRDDLRTACASAMRRGKNH